MTYNTRYCNNPHHSRPATEEERQFDVARRERVVDIAHQQGIYSDAQWETAKRAIETFQGYPRCTLPMGFLSSEIEDFWSTVHEERQRQKEIGFDEDHDRQHGPYHLIEVAQMYIWRGNMTKAAAVLEAWKDLAKKTFPSGHPEIDPEDLKAHSRACGIQPHPHGSSCAEDCPTCHGKSCFSFPVRNSSWPLQGDE